VNVRSARRPPDLLFLVDDDVRHPLTDPCAVPNYRMACDLLLA
jgi:hypothetical protein